MTKRRLSALNPGGGTSEPPPKQERRPILDGRQSRAISNLPPDLLSIPAASARLGLSATTGYELARKGQFPGAVKVGAKWRVSVPKLERYLHEGPALP